MGYKNIADKVLLVVFLLFLFAVGLKHAYKDNLSIEIFYAVMEAALVGGIADWFAITAIFKKPLGFPWHTALISSHRDRVIQAMVDMIEKDLLTVEAIKKRVDNGRFVALLINFIEAQNGKQILRSLLEEHGREIVSKLDLKDIVIYLENFIRNKIREVQVKPQVFSAIRWALEQGKEQQIIVYIVDEINNMLEKPDAKIQIYKYIKVMEGAANRPLLERAFLWLGEQTNSVNVSDAVDALYEESLQMLKEMKNPEHILYQWIHERLEVIIEQPEESLDWAADAENWKMKLADHVELSDTIKNMVENFRKLANSSVGSDLVAWIFSQADQYWEVFKQDNKMQEWLEDRIKQAIYQLIDNEHYRIGEVVKEVFLEFTDEDLNQFVEEKAGEDLQWIRINGSVVGAIVGLVLFLCSHFLIR
jgi:uncharacterized membrane-anchored protein YjiN (DUF445 family)